MKSKLLLVCVCVFFGSNVRHVSSQELMQDIFSFMELNPLDNTGTASDSNSAHLPPLDSLGTPINSLQPNTDTQKAKGLQADTSLSNKPPIKITDSSKPIGTGSPSDQFTSNTGNGADQFPGEAMDPSSQGDPFANDPFANDPFANDPFANDPFANDPFAMDQSTTGGDVPSIHQESPFFQFIPNTFKHGNTNSGSQVQSKPGLPIQTDPAINNDIPSDSFTSSVKQVDTGTSPATGSGHPLDPLSPFDAGIPSEPIQLGAGTPLDSGLPIDPLPVDPLTPDQGMAGGDVPTITNDSPFFRFLPSMPTGDKFLNLNDGTENTFQPTDNWMGEPLGVAKLEPNALDPWDSFLPEEPMTDVNLDPVSAGTNVVDFQPDNQTPILPDSTPVDLNPLGPVKPIVSEKIADPHFKPINPAGDNSFISLGPVDQSTIPLGPSDHNVIPIGSVDHNAIPLGPTDNNIMPNEPLDTKPLPHKETFKPVEPNVIPFGPVDKVPEIPKNDPNVIPLGPIFGTPVNLDSVFDNVNKGQGYDSRRRSGSSSPIADTAKPISNEIPNSWMQLYTKDRRRPSKSLPVQPEQTEAVQISPTDNLLAQASLNTYSKNRGLSRQLRQERRRARKLRQLQNQREKQVQRQQKHQQKQVNKARKQNQKNQRGGNRTGPQGAKIARMVIPGQNRPFVGKNQRGRGRRMVEPCTAERRSLGLCAQDQLPPDNLDPIGHSNHNIEAGIMVGIPDHGLPPIGIDHTHGVAKPIVGPDTYVGRQPADGNAVQHNGNMHGDTFVGTGGYNGRQPAVGAAPLVDNTHGGRPVSMDSYEGRQQVGDSGHLIGGSHGKLLPGTPTFEEHVGIPLGEAVIGHNGLQQLIGVQTVDPQNVGPFRKLGRGGRRQQGNRFNRNKGQRNKGGRIGGRNMRNNRNIGNNRNVGNKRRNNFRKGNKRNQVQINRPGARNRGPIIRTPNMQDVGIDSLPIDNPTGTQHAQESWNPMNGLHVEQPIDPTVHGFDVHDGAQHIFDPLGSGIQISPHSFDPMTGLSGQSANVIQHDAAFHHEPASIVLDERMPDIQHDTAQHGMHVDNLSNGMSDTSLPNKQLGKQKGKNNQGGKQKGKNRQGGQQRGKNKQGGKQKGKNKQGGKQKVVSPFDMTVPDINNSPMFDPQMTINAKNQGRNNRSKVNKKGRNKWKKVKGQNKKEDPKMREPRKFKPVEIQSVITQERKPTTPDTSGMMRIAGLGFLDLSG